MVTGETLYKVILFYENEPLRVKRGSCSWDPLWGESRLLYECVWIVFASQPSAHAAPTLDDTPRQE